MVNVKGLPLYPWRTVNKTYLTAILIMVILSLLIVRFMYVRINRCLSGWKSISDFFERVEFQNLGAVDLHINKIFGQ